MEELTHFPLIALYMSVCVCECEGFAMKSKLTAG